MLLDPETEAERISVTIHDKTGFAINGTASQWPLILQRGSFILTILSRIGNLIIVYSLSMQYFFRPSKFLANIVNKLAIILFITSITTPGMAFEEMTKEELERWFYDDSDVSTADVNEGELVFLDKAKTGRALHSQNQFIVTRESIESGWVKLQQCYQHLDAVMDMQIVYLYQAIRALKILSSSGIKKAWVDGESVQLQDIQHDATICVTAEVRIFYQNPDKSFSMVNGPYHRKFLDGYYPMQVSFKVTFPADHLRYLGMQPEPQKGLHVVQTNGVLNMEAYFEGMLTIEQRFEQISKQVE